MKRVGAEVSVDDQRLEARVRRNANAGVGIVEVHGEIDVSTVVPFTKAVALGLEQTRHIVIDLTRVTYMDSSGFVTLLSATKRLRPLGGRVHLVGCNDLIRRMLQITRLCTLFDLHDSEESAFLAICRAGGVSGATAQPAAAF